VSIDVGSHIGGNGGSQPRWRGDGKELYYAASPAK